MNKWINVESVINKFSMYVGFTTRPDMMRAIQIIKDEPGIDIVRCKECRWSVEDDYRMKCWNIKGLNKTDGVVNPDDYCSYGVKKGADDE